MSAHVLPSLQTTIAGFADLPDTVQTAIHALGTPFPISEVQVRPGAVRPDGRAALALFYADWWSGYLPRLHQYIGLHDWRITLQPWGNTQIIARLEAFGGLLIKESTGIAKGDVHGAQEAEVQAKKRVCAEGLTLGLFFYTLPQVWGRGEQVGTRFVFADGEAERCCSEAYRRAGLLPTPIAGVDLPTRAPAAAPPPSSVPVSSVPGRLARAQQALTEAERRTRAPQLGRRVAHALGTSSGDAPASTKQRTYIALLQTELAWSTDQLHTYAQQQELDMARLTRKQASAFIDELKRQRNLPHGDTHSSSTRA